MSLGVAIVGCGLIGRKRAAALPGGRVVACADLAADRAEALARAAGAEAVTRWQDAVAHPDVDIVVVATTNDALAAVTQEALNAGKHVLVEKPAARNVAELAPLMATAAAKSRARSRRLQPSLSSGAAEGARDRRQRRARAADVRARTLRPRRPRRLRPRVAREPGALRRRRVDRSGRSPNRSLPLVPRSIHDGRRVCRDLLLGHAGRRQRVSDAPHGRRASVRFCTSAAPSGRTCSRWRSTGGQESCRSTGWAAATASSVSPGTRCCPRWVRRTRSAGSFRAAISPGRSNSASSSRTSTKVVEPDPGLQDATRGPGSRRDDLQTFGLCDLPESSTECCSATMIITRSPLRITLGGGGTDLPSYYQDHGGFLIAAAIDKYVYVTVMRPFTPGIFLKYSQLEHVERIDEVQHRLIREALRELGFRTPQIEITTLADIPAGTGLGSSGSFTTALLKALYAHRRRLLHPNELAELACDIEINRLAEPVGKQDQYIAAFGGVTCFTFNPRRQRRTPSRFAMPMDALFNLEDNLLLFFTGFSRSAGSILADQKKRSENHDAEMLANLHDVKELGLRSREALMKGDMGGFGALMHEQWEQKKRRSGRHEQPAHRRVVRAGTRERRDWRQAGWRRRRRLPAVLFGGPSPAPRRNGQGRPRGSAVPLRLRRDEGTVGVSLPVAILAGGLATRLRPVTETIPKALVEVADKPFAVHQLELLTAARSVRRGVARRLPRRSDRNRARRRQPVGYAVHLRS